MLVRLAQSTIILVVAGVIYAIALRWADPIPAAIVVGAIAFILIVAVLIRPISTDSWESFWEGLCEWVWWWQ